MHIAYLVWELIRVLCGMQVPGSALLMVSPGWMLQQLHCCICIC